MRYGLLTPLLPGAQERPPPFIGEEYGAALLPVAVLAGEDPLIHAREHEAVRIDATQFLHEIEREAGPPGPRTVQEADIWIKPDALQRGCTVAR